MVGMAGCKVGTEGPLEVSGKVSTPDELEKGPPSFLDISLGSVQTPS